MRKHMRNIALTLLILMGFRVSVAMAETNVTSNLRRHGILRAQKSGTNSVKRSSRKLLRAHRKSAHQLEKEAQESAIRARYDERVRLWDETHDVLTITNKFEFWGFTFGSTYTETFPDEKVKVAAQAQGLALVSKMVNLKEKKLGFDHACVGFTPCTLLLDNINFYWGVGKNASSYEVNEKIKKIGDRLSTEYGLSVVKKEVRDGFAEIFLANGPMQCDVSYTQGNIYLVVSHRDIKFGNEEQAFVGVIDDKIWVRKVVPASEISSKMKNSLAILLQDVRSYEKGNNKTKNNLTPRFDGMGGVVFGKEWIKDSRSSSYGYSAVGSEHDFDSFHLGDKYGLFAECTVDVSAESHIVYAARFNSIWINDSKQSQAIKDFDAIIGFLEDVCRTRFPRDYLATYQPGGEYVLLCDFFVRIGHVDIRANLNRGSKGLVYEISFERSDIAAAYKDERVKEVWQRK